MNIGLLLKKYELHAIAVGAKQCTERVVADYPALSPYQAELRDYFMHTNAVLHVAQDLDNKLSN